MTAPRTASAQQAALELRAGRPHRARRQHPGRAPAAVQPLRDAVADAFCRPRSRRPQPRLERRHAHAAAAAAQLRRRDHAPHAAAGRRHHRVLRAERVVRRRGRPAAVRTRPRRLPARRTSPARYNGASAPRVALVRRSPTSASRIWSTSTSRRATASWRATPRRCAVWPRSAASCSSICSRRPAACMAQAAGPLTINGIHLNEDGRPHRRRPAARRASAPRPAAMRAAGPAEVARLEDTARARPRQEPAVLLPLASAQRRVHRRPPRRAVRRGELSGGDEAARRDGRRARPHDLGTLGKGPAGRALSRTSPTPRPAPDVGRRSR